MPLDGHGNPITSGLDDVVEMDETARLTSERESSEEYTVSFRK